MRVKKSVMGEIISVFVMILVVAILAGLTFLFVSQLKTQSVSVSLNGDLNVINETVTFSVTNVAQTLSSTRTNAQCNAITYIANGTILGAGLGLGNITQTGCSVINTTGMGIAGTGNNRTVYVSYNVDYTDPNLPSAYGASNATEAAGYTIVGYLPLIFLAVIFGAILTLVLKIILPFINLGRNVGQF